MIFTDPDMSWLPKAAIQGGTTALASSLLIGKNAMVSIPGLETEMPLYALALAVGVAGSLLTDTVHNFVKSEVHLSKKAQDDASLALGAVLSGFLFNAGLYCCNAALPTDFGVVTGFAVGGGAELASALIVDAMY